jgi:RNA polymerase sigma-70 factor (ECF subfamily)
MLRSADLGQTSARGERLEQLFEQQHAAVVSYVRRRVSADGVEDVVAETFLIAWRRLDSVPDEPLPWLLGVARNVIASQRRGASRREALTARLQQLQPRWAEPTGSDGLVATALARLGEKDREALTLLAWDGLRPSEAAMVMGVSAGAFRVRLHRARRRLRRSLDQLGDGAPDVPTTRTLEQKETAS